MIPIILPVYRHRKSGVVAAGMVWSACVAALIPLHAGQQGLAAEPAAAAVVQEDIETGVRVAQILKDAQRKREAGQIAEALADLRVANSLIKKAKGAGHPDTLPVLDMAGMLLLENGQIAEAQTPLGRAVAMREEMVAEGKKVSPVELAAAGVMLARAEMLSGKYDEAGDGLTKALALLESSVGAGHESTLAALEQFAAVHFALGDYEVGEAALGQVLDRRRKSGAAANGSMLSTATTLARARAWSGQAAAAIDPLSAAIADHERGRLDKKLVPPALRQLADLRAETGDDDSARQAIDRALAIDRAAFGDNHAAVIIDRLTLLRLEAAASGAESVGAICDPLVARLQQLAGLGDQQAAAGLRAAAEVWLAVQDFGRASELSRQALELDKRLLGDDHPDVVADEVALGRCLMGNGDAAAALPLLEHALALSKRIRGPRHADTLAVTAAVGDCAARAGNRAAAEKNLQAVLEADVPRRSDADEALLCSLVEEVASLQDRAGDRDRAMETRFSVVALRQRQFGEQHARVADVIVRLANARQAAGAAADAVALYERAVAILEAVHGPDHPEVAAVLAPLAVSYRALGANELAELALARGLSIWEKTVGPDHPVTIATVKPLALVRLALKKDEEALPLMERLLVAYDADPTTPPPDRLKLLKKLAQIHEARGDAEIARRYLERVVATEAALGKTAGMTAGDGGGDDVAVDTSKLKRMLTVDEQAEENLAKARVVASSLEAAQERLSRVDPRGVPKTIPSAAARGPSADRTGGEKSADGTEGAKQSGVPSAAAVIAAARDRHRAGQHDEAVGMLRSAIASSEKPGADTKGPQQAELAELLIALADMRPQVLEWTESVKLYSRAVTVAAAGVGDNHPTTLVAAVRLASAFRAKGDVAAAKDLDELVAARVAATAQKANKQQLESIRESLRGGATVAAAAGDRAATVRALDMLLQTGTDLDDRSLLFAFDLLVELLPTDTEDKAAAGVRSRCLQLAKRAAGSRPVLSGIVQHHLGLAEADAGKLPPAGALLQKAADVDRQTLGRSHPRVAYHLLELAKVRSRQGDGDSAAALLTEVQDIESRAEQATASMVADLRRLATVHTERREFDVAAKLLTAALTAQEKSPDRSSLAMAEIAEQSARLSLARGQFQRAKDLLTESAAIVQSGDGAGHPAAVAALLRKELAGQQEQRPKSVAAVSGDRGAGGAKPAGRTAAAQNSSNFAELLARKEAEAASASRKSRLNEGPSRVADGRDDGPLQSTDQASAGPMSPEAEKARRALDAATRLYGGDPSKRKKPGAGRSGLEGIIAYTNSIENMANDGAPAPDVAAAASEPATDTPRPSGPVRQPAARPAAAPPLAQQPEQPRPSPFVAASRSGLRQRTALARRRAVKVPAKASTSVDDLMLAAWSAHERGSRSEAIAACEEAVTQAGRESGESSRPVADVLDQFATIAIAQGNLVRGKQLLERLGSTRWKLLGPAAPEVADAAVRLAGLLADCGEYERAQPLASRALAARMKAAATQPAAVAESLLLVGKIDLGRGDPTATAARVEEARPLLATRESAGRDAADSDLLLTTRLASVRLLIDLGDLQAASAEADRLLGDLSGDRPVARAMAKEILSTAARAHRLAGDATGAAAIASRLVSIAETPAAGAAFLVQLALAQRASGDPRWEAAAIESGRVLVPYVRRLSPAATDAAATEATAELAAVWLDAGRLDRADEVVTAASIAAAALPPTHPVAVRVNRLAARVALSKGEDPKVASARHALRPVPGDRQRAFLTRVTDKAGVEAVVRHQARQASGVSDPPSQ